MAFEYKQGPWAKTPFNSEQCKAAVNHSWHYNQCSRKPWRDGWCKQHHPDSEKARREKSKKRFREKQENSPFAQAAQQIKELKTRAETSLYVPPEIFSSFVKFLRASIDNMLLDFGDDLEADELEQLKLLQAFCEQHQETN